jgi:hypothetical protein
LGCWGWTHVPRLNQPTDGSTNDPTATEPTNQPTNQRTHARTHARIAQGGDSLEKVISFYVDLSERRCNEARKQADAAAVAAASAKITDLENDVVRA